MELGHAHWHVRVEHNGLDGLLAARREAFHLILCGDDLPVITGIEMVRAIRNFSLNLSSNVLFITSEEKRFHEICTKLGAGQMRLDEIQAHHLMEIMDQEVGQPYSSMKLTR